MSGKIKVIEGNDGATVQDAVNAFGEEHMVFATQSHVNTMRCCDKILYTFVIFHNGLKKKP